MSDTKGFVKAVLKNIAMVCGVFVIFSLIVLPVIWFIHMATGNPYYIIGLMVYIVLLFSILIAAQNWLKRNINDYLLSKFY